MNNLLCDYCKKEINGKHYLLELIYVYDESSSGFNSNDILKIDLCHKCSLIWKRKLEKELKL